MDVKARSKAMREILTRIRDMSRGAIEIKVFGDKVILDEGTSVDHALRFSFCSYHVKMWRVGRDAIS